MRGVHYSAERYDPLLSQLLIKNGAAIVQAHVIRPLPWTAVWGIWEGRSMSGVEYEWGGVWVKRNMSEEDYIWVMIITRDMNGEVYEMNEWYEWRGIWEVWREGIWEVYQGRNRRGMRGKDYERYEWRGLRKVWAGGGLKGKKTRR